MRPALVLAAVAFAACSSPTGNAKKDPGTPIVVNGVSASPYSGPAQIDSIIAVPSAGSIAVTGYFGWGDLCQVTFAYNGYRVDSTLVLRVAAWHPQEACAEMPQMWVYQARIDSLPPGRYFLHAQYDFGAGQWADAAMDTVVVQ